MIIDRLWAMPNKETFKIGPIAELLKRYVITGPPDCRYWVDPFAGDNSPANDTNDLNPDKMVPTHLSAEIFAEQFEGKIDGLLLDPPYSPRQIKECYDLIGLETNQKITNNEVLNKTKSIFAKKMPVGSICISFGWNSNGMGKKRGFDIIEILLIAHGGNHNDTIVTVEKKTQSMLSDGQEGAKDA